VNYKLLLQYDGTDFHGWQIQEGHRTVQGELTSALSLIDGRSVTVHGSGRTDAGVHATSQIVHFDTIVERPLTAWVRGVNASLPGDAAVLWGVDVPDDFHARFAATARHYTYVLLNRPQRPGLLGGRVGWHFAPLDADAMRTAAAHLVGTHDFSSFRAAECQAKSPVKTLHALDIEQGGAFFRFDFSADAFLHHMVRNIVGALVAVGTGKRRAEWIGELLAAADRTLGPATFAPDGLYFRGAEYDARFELPPTLADIPLSIG